MVSKITRIGSKGIVVIPKEIRERLGLREGTVVEIRSEGDRVVLVKKDIWEEVMRRGVKVRAEEAEKELDEVEEEWLRRL